MRHVLESWGARLAGSPAAAAQVADDKIEAQRRLRAAGLRVPRSRELVEAGGRNGLRFPLVLKRPFEHGSRGVVRVASGPDLAARARRWLAAGDGTLLAEEIVEGRELAAGVIEVDGHPHALPIVEVQLAKMGTYTRKMKWSDAALPIEEARLGQRAKEMIQTQALRAFQVLGLRDYARFDIRLATGGTPFFLEANVRPSIEDGTELRLAAELGGLALEGLVAAIIESAAYRFGDASLAARVRTAREGRGARRGHR